MNTELPTTRKYGGPVPGEPRKPVKDINLLPRDYLEECFSYDPDTGIIRWKNRPEHHFFHPKECRRWNGSWAGKEAGSKKCRKRSDHRSTIQICISTKFPDGERHNGRPSKTVLYSAHRLAFALSGRDVPVNMVIDHINGDPWDNRLENLRVLTQQENMRNRGATFGKSGGLPRNIFKRRGSSKELQYEARICIGAFPTIEEALKARNEAEIKLFGHLLHKEDC